MSSGFYRVGSQVDPVGARQRLVAAMSRDMANLSLGLPTVAGSAIEVRASIAAPADMELGPVKIERAQAIQSGFTGDQCNSCSSMRMKVSGHCMVCEDCGTTTGCS